MLSSILAGVGIAAFIVVLIRFMGAMTTNQIAAAHLIDWVRPKPGGLGNVMLVVAMFVAIAGAMGASFVAAFQAWNGYSWGRWVGIGAVVLGATAMVLTTWELVVGLVFLVAVAALLFLPAATRYAAEQNRFRYERALPPPSYPIPERIEYGPVARYRGIHA